MDGPIVRRTPFTVRARDKTLRLGETTAVMAVVNLTPDSFYSGSREQDPRAAVERALALEQAGANILDLGAESTRPGATLLSDDEEWSRLAPALTRLRAESTLPISVDTRKAAVAARALDAGADIINDVSGLHHSPLLGKSVAEHGAALVLMHMRGVPETMQDAPHYDDVMADVVVSLASSVETAQAAGVAPDRILVDPGIGFGKTLDHNLIVLNRLFALQSLEKPILVGTSRKSFIGHLMELPVEERLHATSASVAVAIARGAHAVRVHDVREMKQVATLTDAILAEGPLRPVNEHV